jgi:hypothetical protein
MTYFTFERRRLHAGERTFDGDLPVGEVFARKTWRERLALDDRPPRYLAKLPSGAWLPDEYTARHDAAEALRAQLRLEGREEQTAGH